MRLDAVPAIQSAAAPAASADAAQLLLLKALSIAWCFAAAADAPIAICGARGLSRRRVADVEADGADRHNLLPLAHLRARPGRLRGGQRAEDSRGGGGSQAARPADDPHTY